MLARSVTLNVAGSAAGLVVGFASSLVLARWLGPADRGLLALFLSVSSLALALAGLGVPLAVMYHASRVEARSGALLGDSLAHAAALAAVLVPLAWLARGPLSELLTKGHGARLWPLAAALVPLTFLDWTTHNQLLGGLRFGLYNVLGVLAKLATLALTVVLVAWLGLGVAGGLVAAGAASVVMVAGSLPPVLRRARPALDRRLFGELVRYGGRVQVGALFQLVNYRLDVLVLQAFRPLAGVGTYVVAQIVAELVTTLSTSFQTSLTPLVARTESAEERGTTSIASIRHHGLLALAAVVADVGFGTAVILFGYGPAFRGAIAPMLVLLPGMWFLGAGNVVAGDLRGRGRPGLGSAIAGGTMAVTATLDLALIPPFGVIGAALASLVAYTCFGSASLVALARVSGVPLRRLVVPTREDLALYPSAARSVLARLRPA